MGPSSRAFTLVELLVVIAVIATLSVVVVLVLNPGEILKKGRDSNRLADLPTMNTVLSVYAEDVGGSMGSSSVTYISIPDFKATTTAGTDCSGLGSPFTGGGTFHCAASSTYRKVNGTGWLPVNLTKITFNPPVASLPIDPVNTTSSNEYYSYQTDGTTYKVTSYPESQTYTAQAGTNPNLFTAGNNLSLDGGSWVLVPGNSTFGTRNFYVMKYLPACTQNGVALTTPTTNNIYEDNYNAGANCKPVYGRAPSSLPNAIPIADVTQTLAASYCANIGAHLITNNEWQTIAWDAENNATNWSGGAVGSGYLYPGFNDHVTNGAIVASADDSQGYFGTDGPVSGGGTGAGGVGAQTQWRTFTLSNGSVIWDMNGNLEQWTNNTITGTNEPYTRVGGFGGWDDYTNVISWGSMTQATIGPANSAWNSSQDMGQLYSEGQTDGITYGFLRGGYWYSGSPWGGVEALELFTSPSQTFPSDGFRCAR